MNVVIVMGSPRKGGNTEALCAAFAEGARDRGHRVTEFSVADLNIHPCIGCENCQPLPHQCVFEDDLGRVSEALREADILVIGTPVYFYGVPAQLKALIDRMHTPLRQSFTFTRMALLAVGGSPQPYIFDSLVQAYECVLDYFSLQDAGRILCGNVRPKGAIEGHPALTQAYELGQSL